MRWRARTIVHLHCALLASRPQLKRDPLGGAHYVRYIPLHRFVSARRKWWQKPLVRLGRRVLPAELAVLALDLRRGERGVWMNSRGTASGVVNLMPRGRTFRTQRERLPDFVASTLKTIYRKTKLRKGCPDLVIWRRDRERLRLVEVKCPHWDRTTREQRRFMRLARHLGVPAKVVAWEFRGWRRLTSA